MYKERVKVPPSQLKQGSIENVWIRIWILTGLRAASFELDSCSPERKHLHLQYHCRDQWYRRLRSAEAQKKQLVKRGVKAYGNATSVYLRRKCFQQWLNVDLLRHCLLLVILRHSGSSDQVEGDSGVCAYLQFNPTEVCFGVCDAEYASSLKENHIILAWLTSWGCAKI